MYKITFRLISKCVFIDQPIFDGLLAWCYEQKHFPDRPEWLSIPESEYLDYSSLPLQRAEVRTTNGKVVNYFLASWMFFEGRHEEIHYKRKKWEDSFDNLANFGKLKRKVNVQSSMFKSYELPRVANVFKSGQDLSFSPYGHVWFFFESDDVQGVRDLLNRYLVGLGKDVHRGKGAFSEYTIEKIDASFVPEQMRPVPASDGFETLQNSGKIELRTFKPPYWDVRQAEYCVVPKMRFK